MVRFRSFFDRVTLQEAALLLGLMSFRLPSFIAFFATRPSHSKANETIARSCISTVPSFFFTEFLSDLRGSGLGFLMTGGYLALQQSFDQIFSFLMKVRGKEMIGGGYLVLPSFPRYSG